MVQWQLCTLQHLMDSGFGRPYPRHGLQLLFWFANHCVTCEPMNSVVTMKLVSDCQPEKGFYGFHQFGNNEELLPVLHRPRRGKSKRQATYFDVGNLNTETYPASTNLPTYVRENYGLDGNYSNNNIDRIIISYQVRNRVVETVYVTEHDGGGCGRFDPDRTYEISFELIQILQNPQLDLTTFLIQMGYYVGVPVNVDEYQANDMGEIDFPESAQQMFDLMETYSGSMARSAHSNDLFEGFFSEAFTQQLRFNMEPFNYDQQAHYNVNITSHNSRPAAYYSEVQGKYKKPKATKRPRAVRQSDWLSDWELVYQVAPEEDKKHRGGGISFIKILLGAGALYLAVKFFSWLKSGSEDDLNENVLKMIPWKTPSCRPTHIMLDYVY